MEERRVEGRSSSCSCDISNIDNNKNHETVGSNNNSTTTTTNDTDAATATASTVAQLLLDDTDDCCVMESSSAIVMTMMNEYESSNSSEIRRLEDAIIQEELQIHLLEQQQQQQYILQSDDILHDNDTNKAVSAAAMVVVNDNATTADIIRHESESLLVLTIPDGPPPPLSRDSKEVVDNATITTAVPNNENDQLYHCNTNVRHVFQSIVLPINTTARTTGSTTTTATTAYCSTNTTATPPQHANNNDSLSAQIRNFCVTSVRYMDNNNNQHERRYRLHGHFIVNPLIHTQIVIVVVPKNHPPTNTNTATNTTPTTTISCTLWYGNNDIKNTTTTTNTDEAMKNSTIKGRGVQHRDPYHHDIDKEEWCTWLHKQMLPVIQETCGGGGGDQHDCFLRMNDIDDEEEDDTNNLNSNSSSSSHRHHGTSHMNNRTKKCRTTMTSRSQYFLSAYITCIHEYLQFDHQRRTLQQSLNIHMNSNSQEKNDILDGCTCGVGHSNNHNPFHNNNKRDSNIMLSSPYIQWQQQNGTKVQHLNDHKSTVIHIPIYRYTSTEKVQPYKKCIVADDNDDVDDSGPFMPQQDVCRMLSVVCSWRFHDRKCSLRLHQTAASMSLPNTAIAFTNALRQPDLDQFVAFCGNDVWQAIQLLRKYCSACICWKDRFRILTTAPTTSAIRPQHKKLYHVKPPASHTKIKNRKRPLTSTFHHDFLDHHNDDADDEGAGEDFDEEEDGDDNVSYPLKQLQPHDIVMKRHRKRVQRDSQGRSNARNDNEEYEHQSMNDDNEGLWDGSARQYSWDNEEQSMDDNFERDHSLSPFRLSPSGRRRSDYEVERLVRIERNEHKLSQLGLLVPKERSQVTDSTTTIPKKRYKSRTKKVSVPLSPYRISLNPYPLSESRIYPKRVVKHNGSNLQSNPWSRSSIPLQKHLRRTLPIARSKKAHQLDTPTTAQYEYVTSRENPNSSLPDLPPMPTDISRTSSKPLQPRRTPTAEAEAPTKECLRLQNNPIMLLPESSFTPADSANLSSSRLQGIPRKKEGAATAITTLKSQGIPTSLTQKLSPMTTDLASLSSKPLRHELPIAQERMLPLGTPKEVKRTTTPNGYLTSKENGDWLLPKLPPIPIDTATTSAILYRRPRGVAPGGYTWHKSMGLWIPIGTGTGSIDDLSHDKMVTSKNDVQMSQNFESTTTTPNMCQKSRSLLKLSPVPNDTVITSSKRRKLSLNRPKQTHCQGAPITQKKQLRVQLNTASVAAATPNGYRRSEENENWLLPKLPPIPVDTATTFAILYRRPRGVAPGGYTWHKLMGLWIPIGTGTVSINDLPHKNMVTAENDVQIPQQTIASKITSKECQKAGSLPKPTIEAATSSKRRKLPLNRPKQTHCQDALTTQNMTSKTNVAATSNGYRRSKENRNWLLPKLPPTPVDTATTLAILYRRPRGVAPGGYTWHKSMGLWVPIGADDIDPFPRDELVMSKYHLETSHQTVSTPIDPSVPITSDAQNIGEKISDGHADYFNNHQSETKKVGKHFDMSRTKNRKGFGVLPDGCLQPKKDLKFDKDGFSYRRPHGASPAGFDWDPIRGLWKPIDGTVSVAPTARNFYNNNQKLRNDVDSRDIDQSKQNDSSHSEYSKYDLIETFNGFLILSDGCLLPKKELNHDGGSVYRRPHGACPSGFDWDSIRGVWKPIDVTTPIATTTLQRQTNRQKSNGNAPRTRPTTENVAVTSTDKVLNWNSNGCVWEPRNNDATAVMTDITGVDTTKNTTLAATTPCTVRVSVKNDGGVDDDEMDAISHVNNVGGNFENHFHYPKRKRIRLQRYTPPL